MKYVWCFKPLQAIHTTHTFHTFSYHLLRIFGIEGIVAPRHFFATHKSFVFEISQIPYRHRFLRRHATVRNKNVTPIACELPRREIQSKSSHTVTLRVQCSRCVFIQNYCENRHGIAAHLWKDMKLRWETLRSKDQFGRHASMRRQ